MVAERLDVRLDSDRRRKLVEIAAARHAPVSAVIRDLIDQAYEEELRAERMRAALALGILEVEDVPDPETLSQQLASAYDTSDLR